MSQPYSRGSSAQTLASLDPPLEDQLSTRMRDAVQKMKHVVPVLSVCILSLRRQNAELDDDVATVLDQHASAPLDTLVDELEFFLEHIATQLAQQRRAAA